MPNHPIARLLERSSRRVLGINTGTSIDGLDLALIEIKGTGHRRKIHLVRTASYAFPRVLRDTLRALAFGDRVQKQVVTEAHYRLGEWIAQCVLRFREELPRPARIDLIGSHGQTIGHFPHRRGGRASLARLNSATWQIGSAAVVAQQTGIVTIGDFRAADIAAGGMGAPLSGYYHHLMFGPRRVVLNLGGIANISAVRGHGRRLEILAFDIGPGNMVIDAIASKVLARRFDRDGNAAATGTPDPHMRARARRHPFFKRRPPKTCGREEFGDTTVRAWLKGQSLRANRAPMLLASAVAITADAVAEAIQRWIEPYTRVRSLVLCGGGTRNRTLVRALHDRLMTGWRLVDSGRLGIPAQFVEPAGFALLAEETIQARPGNIGRATGGAPAILGAISLPGGHG